MEKRIDQSRFARFKREAPRHITMIFVFFIIVGLSFILPSTKEQMETLTPQMGIFTLLITVSLKTTAGVYLAHIFRKGLFPFLDFMKLLDEHHWAGITFMTVWYGVFIYAFAMGG